MSVPGQREAPSNEKHHTVVGTLTSSNSDYIYISNFPIKLYISRMLQPLLNILTLAYLENYVRIVAFTPALRRVSFYSVTGLLHHSTTIKLAPLLKLINNLHPSLRVLQEY